jgi:hypothetical protein
MKSRVALSLFIVTLLGCGSSESVVTGTVTFNQAPVADGYITLFPVTGTKGTKGAPVKNGKFSLKNVPPGEWKAVIAQTPQVQLAQNSAEPATLNFANGSTTISPQTPGNQVVIQVRPGKQSLDFALRDP